MSRRGKVSIVSARTASKIIRFSQALRLLNSDRREKTRPLFLFFSSFLVFRQPRRFSRLDHYLKVSLDGAWPHSTYLLSLAIARYTRDNSKRNLISPRSPSKSKGFFFFNGILRIGESLSINFTNFSPIASTTIFGERYLKWILLGFLIFFTSRSFSSFFRFVSHARFLWNLEFLETVVTPEGRGGFIVITSSKVHSNVLESRVRLFLNGRRKDPFETTPPGVSFEGIIVH